MLPVEQSYSHTSYDLSLNVGQMLGACTYRHTSYRIYGLRGTNAAPTQSATTDTSATMGGVSEVRKVSLLGRAPVAFLRRYYRHTYDGQLRQLIGGNRPPESRVSWRGQVPTPDFRDFSAVIPMRLYDV